MAGNLVTVATFDLPAKARLAQNVLEEAGIKAVVTDETTVAMDWLLGNAIGWVKVQVLEEDAERAVAVLEESLGPANQPIDNETLAAEAEAADAEEGIVPPEPTLRITHPPDASQPQEQIAIAPSLDEEGEPKPSERDEYARRFLLTAVFGLVIPLLWFYAIYLFLNTAFGEGPISERGKTKLLTGGLILLLGSFMALLLFRIYGDPFP